MDFLKGKYALAISIGAIFGALSRYYLTVLTKEIISKDAGFIATFGINILGCLIIAYILTLATDGDRYVSPELRLMTTTGFCGAFTTFSTYGLETQAFMVKSDMNLVLLYGLGSLIVGMVGVQIGVFLARLNKAN